MSFNIFASKDHLIIEDLSSILPCVCSFVEFVDVHPTTLFDLEKGIFV